MIDEDPPHDPRGQREEVRAVVPRDVPWRRRAQIGLVDERGRLQAVAHAFARHAAPRDLVQLLVHERNQPVEGGRIALVPSEQQPGDIRGGFRDAVILGRFPLDSCSRSLFPLLQEGGLVILVSGTSTTRPGSRRVRRITSAILTLR